MSQRNAVRSRHRFERANPNARNFGLRARCMLKAAVHTMEERRLASACGFGSRHQQVKGLHSLCATCATCENAIRFRTCAE